AARRDESSVRSMETRCATEQGSRRPDKHPSRDATSKRPSSTTNKAPLPSFRHTPRARLRTLHTPSPGCTSPSSSRACRLRGLRRSQKRGKAEFFSQRESLFASPLRERERITCRAVAGRRRKVRG